MLTLVRQSLFVSVIAATLCVSSRSAEAVTKVLNICTIDGQTELTLRGMGLVVGLNGTGDPDGNAATLRPFAAYLKLSNNPIVSQKELKKLSSVAVVEVTARVPRTGISRGQQLDCKVSTLFGAKSLEGGRLIVTPLELAGIADDTLMGLADGTLIVKDTKNPTTARVADGLVMDQTIDMNILRTPNQIRLLIGKQYAGYRMARELSRAINTRFEVENFGKDIAVPKSAGAVDVVIPKQYENPVDFIALLMDIVVNEAGTVPRVIINSKTGSVVVTGNVTIAPVAITHRSLNVEVVDPFVELSGNDGRQPQQQLTDLLTALNQLKVPSDDIISILRDLNASGHMHAELIER